MNDPCITVLADAIANAIAKRDTIALAVLADAIADATAKRDADALAAAIAKRGADAFLADAMVKRGAFLVTFLAALDDALAAACRK